MKKLKNIIIAGTDTNIGKTICSTLLMSVLNGTYLKPIQSGSKEDNDTKTVKKISGLAEEHFLNEIYLLKEPLSPHQAAESDNIIIDEEKLFLPKNITFKPLIVELAGGLMVPINRQKLMIDIIKNWNAKVILCARTSLGTINHTLLSIEALKSRNIDLAGIVFIGKPDLNTQKTIIQFSGVKQLGIISHLNKINKKTLEKIFYDNFDVKYFNENYK